MTAFFTNCLLLFTIVRSYWEKLEVIQVANIWQINHTNRERSSSCCVIRQYYHIRVCLQSFQRTSTTLWTLTFLILRRIYNWEPCVPIVCQTSNCWPMLNWQRRKWSNDIQRSTSHCLRNRYLQRSVVWQDNKPGGLLTTYVGVKPFLSRDPQPSSKLIPWNR